MQKQFAIRTDEESGTITLEAQGLNRRQRLAQAAQARKVFTLTLPTALSSEAEAELRAAALDAGIKRLRIVVG